MVNFPIGGKFTYLRIGIPSYGTRYLVCKGGPGGPPPGNKYRICPKIWPEGPSWGVWGCTTPKVSLYTRAYPLQTCTIRYSNPISCTQIHRFSCKCTLLHTDMQFHRHSHRYSYKSIQICANLHEYAQISYKYAYPCANKSNLPRDIAFTGLICRCLQYFSTIIRCFFTIRGPFRGATSASRGTYSGYFKPRRGF